ncbi:MAG: bifunctional diguanylate cyclase/phosphodiesterase [Bauldia sp.]
MADLEGAGSTSVRRATLRFAWRVGLPALGVLAATALAVFAILSELAAEANRVDHAVTEMAADAAVRSALNHLAATHEDYAVWDEAAEKLYGDVDQAFVAANIVGSTQAGKLYDIAVLLDEAGADAFAYAGGVPVGVASREFFGPPLAALIASLADAPSLTHQSAGILATPDGLVAAVVGPVVPASEAAADAEPRPQRLLLIAKRLDDVTVNALGEEFVIPSLRLAAGEEFTGGLTLRDPSGKAVGTLFWTDRNPGAASLASATPLLVAVLSLLGLTLCLVLAAALRSVFALERAEGRARRLALQDGLSGLPNRDAFNAALDQALAADDPALRPAAVIYLDLDGFKAVNDRLGHAAGDLLIRRLGGRFAELVRGKGVLARIGGDEFAILVHGEDNAAAATSLADGLIERLLAPVEVDGQPVSVGTSVGVALYAPGLSAVELLRRADLAMYAAKADGRNRVRVFDSGLESSDTTRIRVAAELAEAVALGKLDVVYQPIAAAATREIVGVEALLRWMRDGVEMPTDLFIGIAEESGIIHELGQYVLDRACRAAAAWPELPLSINVSPAQFRAARFEEQVLATLKASGLAPQRLTIELTETYLIAEPDRAKTVIARLREAGVRIALDDFGSGYASIGYLRQFAFDELKLDHSLTAGVATDSVVQRLVQATAALGHALDLPVTAEGVEGEAEAVLLRLAGCQRLQGYFISPSLTAEETAALAARLAGRGQSTAVALRA